MSQQINLFNPIFLKKKTLFSALAMMQALGLIILGLAALTFMAKNREMHVKEVAARATAQLGVAQQQLTQIVERTRPTQKDKNIEEAIKLAESRLKGNQQILDFVRKGDFGDSAGYSEFFRAFSRRTVPGVWLTGFSLGEGGNGMVIQGRALQPNLVPSYLAILKQEALFRGKSFASLELRAPQPRESKVDTKSNVSAKIAAELPYVEFTLRSSDAIDDRADQNEARAK